MQIQLKPTFIKIEEQTKKIYIDQEDIYIYNKYSINIKYNKYSYS